MHTYFIADLHLDETAPHKVELFLNFLQTQAIQADALYILGDLFEAWVGDDLITPLIEKVKKALYHLTEQGIPVYFMPGNRDFLIGRRFLNAANVELLADPTLLNLYGQRVLLLHGDTLCTKDKAYLRFRRWVRHPWFKGFFLKLPLSWRSYLAKRARQKSQAYTTHAPSNLMDITKAALKKMFQIYHCTVVIHGHTHRPTLSHLTVDMSQVQHFVLSDWDEYGNVLAANERGEFRLYNFKTLPFKLL